MSNMLNSSGALNRGDLEIIVRRGRTGQTERFVIKNLFTDDGLAYLAARAAGEAVGVISHMALGTGTTPAAGADKTLEVEIAGSRVPVTISGTGAQRLLYRDFRRRRGVGPRHRGRSFQCGRCRHDDESLCVRRQEQGARGRVHHQLDAGPAARVSHDPIAHPAPQPGAPADP